MNLSVLQASLALVVAVTAAGVLATSASPPASAEQLAAALTAPADESTSVRLDLVKPDPAGDKQLVLVAVQGGDEAARVERAARVRQRLSALGVPPQQVFTEDATRP